MFVADFQLTVENQFDYLCRLGMINERKNYYQQLSNQLKKEVTFTDLGIDIVNTFSTIDTYPIEFNCFELLGHSVGIKNDALSTALAKLSENKRNIVLLYYFFNLKDTEIAKVLQLDFTTINRHRNQSLDIIKSYMEE